MSEEINKKYLKEKQYKSTKYLEARIRIHQYTKNKIGFHEWIFNQYDLSQFQKTPVPHPTSKTFITSSFF